MPRISSHMTAAVETQQLAWASDEQKQVFEYGPAPICASGGFGASKTWACVMKGLVLSDLFPGNRGVIVRRRFVELQKTTMATFFKLLPFQAYRYGGRRNDQEKVLRLNNGSEILFMHLDDPEVASVIKGLEINWFFIDQAEEVAEEIFDKLMSRLGRWDGATVPNYLLDREQAAGRQWAWKDNTGKPIPPTYGMIACNPDHKLHWIYRRFHPDSPEHWEERASPDGGVTSYRQEGYRLVNMTSWSNRFLTDQNRQHLMNQDISFRRRYAEGEWGNPEGQIHQISELSKIPGTRELVDHLVRTCALHRSLDHGDSAPTCCGWWAVDQSGNVFLFQEYYMPDKLISYHRREITALSQSMRFTSNMADPQIFAKTQQKYGGMWSVADEYNDTTVDKTLPQLFWEPGDNNELMTRSKINEYLQVDKDRIHPITKERGSPRLFFLMRSDAWPSGVVRTTDQITAQMRVKIGTEMGRPVFSDDRDEAIVDHAYDMARYFMGSRPSVAAIVMPRSNPNSFQAVRRNLIKFQKRGGYEKLAMQRTGRIRQRGY